MYAENKARTNLIRSIRYTNRALYHRKGTTDQPGRFSTPSFRHADVTSVLSQVGIIRADKPAKLRPRDKIETGGPSFCSFSNFTRREFSSFAFDRGGIHLGFAAPNPLATEIRFDERNGIKAKLAESLLLSLRWRILWILRNDRDCSIFLRLDSC